VGTRGYSDGGSRRELEVHIITAKGNWRLKESML